MHSRIWITWENQRRSISLAEHFGCKLYLLEYSGWSRYLKSILETVHIISKNPDIVFVQNPSMVLATLACFLKRFYNIKVIVDRHTTFRLNKPESKSFRVRIFNFLHRYTVRHADLTIITNNFLAKKVESIGGKSFVLPDKVPTFSKVEKVKLKGKHNFFFISSFSNDEPIEEVFAAMKELPEDMVLYISGNYKKLAKEVLDTKPANVILTGFLSEQDFINMLGSVDGILVLTTSDYVMLCGCYEAVSVEKPLITSDKDVLKEYFKSAFFVDNKAKSIAASFKEIIKNPQKYSADMSASKKEIVSSWDQAYKNLESTLESIKN